jgi:Anti-sigma-K factor rskA
VTVEDDMGVPEHKDTIERLERGVARVPPPDGLFERILDEVRPGATVIPFRRRRLPAWASSAAAAALAAAAAVAVTVAVTRDEDGLGDAIREVRISNERVDGKFAVYRQDDGNRLLVVDLDRVPSAQRDQFYEIWISRPGSNVKIPVGAFIPRAGHAHLEVPLPTEGKRLSIDISVEEQDGPPEHSGETVAAARLL